MSIDLEVDERVAVVRINRPDALNALDREAKAQLKEAWNEVAARDDVRVAVLTGTGDKAFCVGSDLKEAAGEEAPFVSQNVGTASDPHPVRGLPQDKPLIAALNGHALGGGLEMALACDIRIASVTATVGLPEVRVGSMPGAGGTQNLLRVVNSSDAMYLLLTGERIDAARALSMGLISEVCDPQDLRDRAMEIAARIASNAPLSVRATKRAALVAMDVPASVGLDYERNLWGLIKATDDRAEGRAAFREKREPDYRGR